MFPPPIEVNGTLGPWSEVVNKKIEFHDSLLV